MRTVSFEREDPLVPTAPNRADIACFVGFVGRRDGPLPAPIHQWLVERGWLAPPGGAPLFPRAGVEQLRDVPVPVESWALFDRLFAWDRRPVDDRDPSDRGPFATSYLGAAVRSFFAQGGRKCYVVRVGDPCALTAPGAMRRAGLAALIPGFPAGVTSVARDPASWTGVGHVVGLEDVSFVCLPDLPDAVRSDRAAPDVTVPLPPRPERFSECSDPEPAPPPDTPVPAYPAPTCDWDGYMLWAQALERVAFLLTQPPREAQLVAALPLPVPRFEEHAALAALLGDFLSRQLGSGGLASPSLGTSFLQLAYPWVRTPGSANLPAGLEGPDGVVVGVLARNALARGTYRSAAGLDLADVSDVYPLLSERELSMSADRARPTAPRAPTFAERVSLVGREPAGIRLLSDVTASATETYRPGSVHRLVSAILRAARRLGEDVLFEPSSERVWATITAHLDALMLALYQDGALRGADASEAFQVRCGRSTMTQHDIDSGRVIAAIQFQAAAPVEHITVVLALDATGQVSLVPGRALARVAA